MNTTTFDVFCYDCNLEIDSTRHKKLLECVEFIKKEGKKPFINNIEDKIASTLINTIRPLLANSTITNTTMSLKPTGTATTGGSVKNVKIAETKMIQTIDNLPRVRGLTNFGNTCFFNAVLQCLAQTPYLLSVLRENQTGEE